MSVENTKPENKKTVLGVTNLTPKAVAQIVEGVAELLLSKEFVAKQMTAALSFAEAAAKEAEDSASEVKKEIEKLEGDLAAARSKLPSNGANGEDHWLSALTAGKIEDGYPVFRKK